MAGKRRREVNNPCTGLGRPLVRRNIFADLGLPRANKIRGGLALTSFHQCARIIPTPTNTLRKSVGTGKRDKAKTNSAKEPSKEDKIFNAYARNETHLAQAEKLITVGSFIDKIHERLRFAQESYEFEIPGANRRWRRSRPPSAKCLTSRSARDTIYLSSERYRSIRQESPEARKRRRGLDPSHPYF